MATKVSDIGELTYRAADSRVRRATGRRPRHRHRRRRRCLAKRRQLRHCDDGHDGRRRALSPDATPWADIGWKALAVNVSDIGAMGRRAGVRAGHPGAAAADQRAGHGRALRRTAECAQAYGVTIAGGDVVSAPQVSVTVALLGRAQAAQGEPCSCCGAARERVMSSPSAGAWAPPQRGYGAPGRRAGRGCARPGARARPSPLSLGQEAARAGIRGAGSIVPGRTVAGHRARV